MANREGPSRRVELVRLDELKRANRNPKTHDVAFLVSAIGDRDTGVVDLPIIDERTGQLVAGHGRLKALEALYLKDPEHPPKGVTFEGRNNDDSPVWLVEVVRGWSSRDDAHAEAVLVALNRAPQRGGWDLSLLAPILNDLPPASLELSGFSLDDLGEMTSSAKLPRNLSDESNVPSGDAVKVRQGDVWGLGEHVIACGESPTVLRGLIGAKKPRAVITDPPYGINIVGGDRAVGGGGLAKANRYAPVANDDKPFDPKPYLAMAKRVVLFGANHFADRLPASPSWLVWDKRDGLASNDFADGELAWTNIPGPVRIFRHRWSGMLKASERGTKRQHPTQKPIALFQWVIELATKRGDLVVDPFLGAGACLLACEVTGRTCIAAELEPAYVQVTIDRWQEATGKTAVLLDRPRTRKGRK